MRNSELDALKSYLTQLPEEDLICALYVYNRPNIYNNRGIRESIDAIEKDIAKLNSLDKLRNISRFIIDEMNNSNGDDIYYFLRDLKDFQSRIKIHSFDFNKIKDNQRFLQFACKVLHEKEGDRLILDIKNLYFQLLYLAYTIPIYYENSRSIENIYYRFDKIYTKFNSHFKSPCSDFFVWAKKYINENSEFRRYRRDASHVSEYETLINSIFDIIYYEDENIHYALRKKLSNAWYQKKHREEKKVKKPNYYALTKRAREALLTLAFKNGVSEEQMIERLINETYAKECCSVDGENLYL
ncbi:hypothetical protein HMPREF0017_02545 [Acinetobacter lwoffii SH145]|uniref:hypothetical protein n=1 Tax=Acinetobacter lwoffii TaxID=28090 RepID=UPI0001BBA635|nr:hypothetical protein [Acinetobacter lwoffii]EEY88771.1 hypothetical protein HMPREF0017_02545 [Acinetobacter lwoffii SH145]